MNIISSSFFSCDRPKKAAKIGGVYSADGHIVVQEGKSNYAHPRATKGSHGVFDHFLHPYNHHKNKNK